MEAGLSLFTASASSGRPAGKLQAASAHVEGCGHAPAPLKREPLVLQTQLRERVGSPVRTLRLGAPATRAPALERVLLGGLGFPGRHRAHAPTSLPSGSCARQPEPSLVARSGDDERMLRLGRA